MRFLKLLGLWILAVGLMTFTATGIAWTLRGLPEWVKGLSLVGGAAFFAVIHWYLTHPMHDVELFPDHE